MGTWGVAILSDDLAKDVYDEFMEMYDNGLDIKEIRMKLEDSYLPLDDDERPVFFLALAKAQWECKALDKDVFLIVKDIVDNEIGMELWRVEGDSKYKKRLKVLYDFLDKLGTEKEKARNRKKIKKAEAIFEPGDCLTFTLQDGSYGGALVLGKDNTHKTEGYNIIAVLDLRTGDKPTEKDFLESGVLILKTQLLSKTTIEPAIVNCLARLFKKHKHLFEVAGNITITKEFPLARSYCNWDYLILTSNTYYFNKNSDVAVQGAEMTVSQMLGIDNNIIHKMRDFFKIK